MTYLNISRQENRSTTRPDSKANIVGTIGASAEWGQEYLYSFTPDVDMDFVLRLLGSKQKGGDISHATRLRLRENTRKVLELISPKIITKIYEIRKTYKEYIELANGIEFKSRKLARYLKGADRIMVLAGTVGIDIDVEIDRMLGEKRLADAYTLDALGSGSVESLVEKFHREATDQLLQDNYISGLRFSPGYCDWPIAEQHKLFSLFNAERIGLQLEPSGLMQPRKSISAVFGIFDELHAKELTSNNPCQHCAKKDCIARRT
jgi:hypothetical protein